MRQHRFSSPAWQTQSSACAAASSRVVRDEGQGMQPRDFAEGVERKGLGRLGRLGCAGPPGLPGPSRLGSAAWGRVFRGFQCAAHVPGPVEVSSARPDWFPKKRPLNI